MAVQDLTILGATGSIGKSTIDIVERNPDAFEIVALTAQSNVTDLANVACGRGRGSPSSATRRATAS